MKKIWFPILLVFFSGNFFTMLVDDLLLKKKEWIIHSVLSAAYLLVGYQKLKQATSEP